MGKFADRTVGMQSPPTALILSLLIVAAFMTVGGIITAFVILLAAAKQGVMGPDTLATAAELFLGGWAGGCVLWALAWLVRRGYMDSLIRPAERPEPSPPASSNDAALAEQTELLGRLAAELSEIKSNLLLGEPQRQAKLLAWQTELANRFEVAMEKEAKTGQFTESEAALEALKRNMPDYPQLKTLTERLDSHRHQDLGDKINSTLDNARSLIGAGKVLHAQALANQLVEQFPASHKVGALAKQIRQEVQQSEAAQVSKLFQRLDTHARKREWSLALEVAKEVVEEFGESNEARIIRERLPTLTDNARIEEVRHLRDEIRQHISNQEFGLAYKLALQVVERFPETTAASELRDQLPRLKGRAEM